MTAKEYAQAPTLQELRYEYADIRNSPLLLRAKEDAEEFGGGYTLRLCTTSRALNPGIIDILAEHGLGVEYLGEPEDLHEWVLLEK